MYSTRILDNVLNVTGFSNKAGEAASMRMTDVFPTTGSVHVTADQGFLISHVDWQRIRVVSRVKRTGMYVTRLSVDLPSS